MPDRATGSKKTSTKDCGEAVSSDHMILAELLRSRRNLRIPERGESEEPMKSSSTGLDAAVLGEVLAEFKKNSNDPDSQRDTGRVQHRIFFSRRTLRRSFREGVAREGALSRSRHRRKMLLSTRSLREISSQNLPAELFGVTRRQCMERALARVPWGVPDRLPESCSLASRNSL